MNLLINLRNIFNKKNVNKKSIDLFNYYINYNFGNYGIHSLTEWIWKETKQMLSSVCIKFTQRTVLRHTNCNHTSESIAQELLKSAFIMKAVNANSSITFLLIFIKYRSITLNAYRIHHKRTLRYIMEFGGFFISRIINTNRQCIQLGYLLLVILYPRKKNILWIICVRG